VRDQAIEVLKVLIRYAKHEIEDPSRMDSLIIAAVLSVFDDRATFYLKHKVDDHPKKTEKEDSKSEDAEKESQDVEMVDVPVDASGSGAT